MTEQTEAEPTISLESRCKIASNFVTLLTNTIRMSEGTGIDILDVMLRALLMTLVSTTLPGCRKQTGEVFITNLKAAMDSLPDIESVDFSEIPLIMS